MAEPLSRILLKALGVWLLLVLLAILNGWLRDALLTPWLGAELSLPLSGLTLAGLVLLVSYVSVPCLGRIKTAGYLTVGLFWLLLTLAFEYLFGHFVLEYPWQQINRVFDISEGNLFVLVLVVTVLAPWLAARLRGLI